MKITNIDTVKTILSRLQLCKVDDSTVTLKFAEDSRGNQASAHHPSLPDVNIAVKFDNRYAIKSNMTLVLDLKTGELTGDMTPDLVPAASKSPTQGCLTRPSINY